MATMSKFRKMIDTHWYGKVDDKFKTPYYLESEQQREIRWRECQQRADQVPEVLPWMADYDATMTGHPNEDSAVKLFEMEYYFPIKNTLEFETKDYIEMFFFNRYIRGLTSLNGNPKPTSDQLVCIWQRYLAFLHANTDKWVELLRYQFTCFRNHSPTGAMIFLHMKSLLCFGKCMVSTGLNCPMCAPETPKMNRVIMPDRDDDKDDDVASDGVRSALMTMDLVFAGKGTPKYGPPVNDRVWRVHNAMELWNMLSDQETIDYDEVDNWDLPNFALEDKSYPSSHLNIVPSN